MFRQRFPGFMAQSGNTAGMRIELLRALKTNAIGLAETLKCDHRVKPDRCPGMPTAHNNFTRTHGEATIFNTPQTRAHVDQGALTWTHLNHFANDASRAFAVLPSARSLPIARRRDFSSSLSALPDQLALPNCLRESFMLTVYKLTNFIRA